MPIRVAELSWQELQQHIYAPDGSLPDTFVLGTTRTDWRRWAEFVQATYPVTFEGGIDEAHEQINWAAVEACWDGAEAAHWPRARIQVGRCRINCFFLSEDLIDGDIDPRQIRTPDDHQQLLHYLTSISRLLGKRVVMLAEGTRRSANALFDPAPLISIEQGEAFTDAYWR